MASCWLLHREVKTRKDLSRKPVLWSMFYSNSAALRSGAAMLAGVKYVLGHKQLCHPPSLLILQCCWVAFASGGSSQLIRFLSTGCVILLSGPYSPEWWCGKTHWKLLLRKIFWERMWAGSCCHRKWQPGRSRAQRTRTGTIQPWPGAQDGPF